MIALSCLMTTTMPNLKSVIDALKEMKVREQYPLLVGGGALTQTFAGIRIVVLIKAIAISKCD